MSNCFSCGRSFNGSVNELLQIYKRDYLENGTERYFYKTSSNSDVYVVKKSSFKRIFDSEIKPNFDNGAEYAHIQEYNARP
jgi:hypothetical protein